MSKGLYPIRTISSMTGVNPVTLRAWERRYGLIRPQRTDKGHRLYTEQDIDRIRQILVLIDRGIPISQARQVLDPDDAPPERETGADGSHDTWVALRERMENALRTLDDRALDAVRDEALSLFAPAQVWQRLVEPLYLGLDADRADADGQAARAFLCGWLTTTLHARLHQMNRSTWGARVVMARPEDTAESVPLLLQALTASDEGYRIVFLDGAPAPATLCAAARTAGAQAIVLWSNRTAPDHRFLQALQDEAEWPVLLTGAAADWQPEGSRFVPVSGGTGALTPALDRALAESRR